MVASFSAIFLATFVFVNIILAAPGVQSCPPVDPAAEPVPLTDGIVPADNNIRLPRDAPRALFIGDLIIGKSQANQKIYQKYWNSYNPGNSVVTQWIRFTTDNYNEKVHYASVTNRAGSFGAVCDTPWALGTSASNFTVRIPPTSTVTLELTFGTH